MKRAWGAFLVTLLGAGCDWRTVEVIRPVGGTTLNACELGWTDPEQQRILLTDDRSHWHQPWRAYQETFPAKRMRDALGITSINRLSDSVENSRLAVAHDAGLARLYTTVDWADMDFADPTKLQADVRSGIHDWMVALKSRKLRPHIMLQGYHGIPCPSQTFTVKLTSAAAMGSRQIHVDPANVPDIVPGRSGFDNDGRGAGILFTAATKEGLVTLSKPLSSALSAGARDARELRFAPFVRPMHADGSPNPAFEETMAGWEKLIVAVATAVVTDLGSDGFDLEIWNELSGGSDFLDANAYYDAPVDDGPGPAFELVSQAMLERSAAAVQKKGFSQIHIISGFSNTRLTDTAAGLPDGVWGLSRHVAIHGAAFPDTAAHDTTRALRLDGALNGKLGTDGRWVEDYTPTYNAVFPEQALTPVISYRPFFPDASPTPVYDSQGNAHGRLPRVHGGSRPSLVISAFNLSPSRSLVDLDKGPTTLTEADLWRFKVKSILRATSAYVGKGVESLIFYSTNDKLIDLVDETDTVSGGAVLRGLKRFLAYFAGPETIDHPRSIALQSVTACQQKSQWKGNGTSAFPDLSDGEVVAFFPFQIDDNHFVAPAYVMTRNLAKLYQSSATTADLTRFDLPAETFTLKLRGLTSPRIDMTDALTGQTSALAPLSLADGTVTVDVPLTDSPRLLQITDHP